MTGRFLPGVPGPDIEAIFEAAPGNEIGTGKFDNPESSAALAANAFGFFLNRASDLPALPGCEGECWPARSLGLEVDIRFPWHGGHHPVLDCLVETPSALIGIESKRFEPYRSKPASRLSDAYWRPVWGENMTGYESIRDRLRSDPRPLRSSGCLADLQACVRAPDRSAAPERASRSDAYPLLPLCRARTVAGNPKTGRRAGNGSASGRNQTVRGNRGWRRHAVPSVSLQTSPRRMDEQQERRHSRPCTCCGLTFFTLRHRTLPAVAEALSGHDHAVILFDGTCAFCEGSVKFMALRDPAGYFKYGAAQSPTAAALLAPYGIGRETARSIVLIEAGQVYLRSTASLRIARRLPFPWSLAGALLVVPRPLHDAVYRVVAAVRQRLAGSSNACEVPPPEIRQRLV